ncbi:hypothetical protein [Microbacterium sp. HJ5]
MNDEICIDPHTFNRSGSGAVSGKIWIRIGGEAFPEDDWSDFPLIVLKWWIVELRRFRAGSPAASLHFMDGDFGVSLTRDGSRIVARRERAGVVIGEVIQVDAESLFASALVAATDVISRLSGTMGGSDLELLVREAIS